MQRLLEIKITRSIKQETGRLPVVHRPNHHDHTDSVSPDPGPLK